ncbi:MAG: sigma 54-interacting transcriptional regulator [Clostridium sp.]|jgi:transcriptional regulator with PAS, ATPase and Fis domain|uniref:sigma 54-interacting transcriptional regulator n=1 Tax=Clostridium sp. TaxID=1506 RepID=UPI0025C338A2|nr:sigma 54-interacting transcriptional regulator [Clostridium sp.]MCH3965984.1 sigma 54-interacting transcriptional regulator [Clostridium sp.]MCI1715928.1 sigma 54-interacting transcriptional regulator [Clostridium sp.]MCI1800400.1 sigma 54-interacting transcriptional regulator [Clostridium sp.]MCI1814105.1 sigma 54-interacting transcriptional regulator [Clostridium sp.]MCI1871003.1 sigma 54-interacting transcriptional regulator [Clostridium sp.]
MNNNILLVAPYHGLEILARKFNEKSKVKLSIIEGNMNQSIDEVNYAVKNGIRIVLSRWGTSNYLKGKVDVPVIDISATPVDVLKAVNKIIIEGYKKVAIVNVSNIIGKSERQYLNKILGINLQFSVCHGVNDVRMKVKYLAEKEHIDAIIGDVTAVYEARKAGIYAELLESGEESIVNALSLCTNILNYDFISRYRNEQIRILLNRAEEGIVLKDKTGNLLFNSNIERLFRYYNTDISKENLYKILNGSRYEEIPVNVDKKYVGSVFLINQKSANAVTKNNLEFRAKYKLTDIIGQDDIKTKAAKFAKSNETVIIYGETGTGKELFAQSIHNESKRSGGPFISVNCAALSESLIESELFGYEDGAFTGAVKGGKKGLFELANNGTLFLDEIGEVSLNFQRKLLRVLQENEIRRVGGNRNIPVNVRIICATNKNLKEECRKNNFRYDLYYRINVLELKLQPLRFRKKDIIPLFERFIDKQCIIEGKKLNWNNDKIFLPLLKYSWYGNVRELQNFAKFVVACSEGTELNEQIISNMLESRNLENSDEINIRFSYDLKEMESEIFNTLLDRYNGDKDKLCLDFNISRTTLWRKLNSM